ncbi:MAG: hypothetical protein ACRCVN_03280 [Spirochaetia bacterium]
MNQDQVKNALLQLEPSVAEFKVIFSGKKSKKLHGIYHPEKQEIIIHNENFTQDNALVYIAIHEFAHHVCASEADRVGKYERRPHTIAFRNTLHKLLKKAEQEGIYKNIFESHQEFQTLTKKIKDHYLAKNGNLMKEFGALLIQAFDLCQQHQASFEDYAERVLSMQRTQARTVMKVYALDIDPKIGYENMRIAASAPEQEDRKVVQDMLSTGESPDTARAYIREHRPKVEMTVKRLESEKKRIERSLEQLQKRLQELESKIQSMND